MLGRRFLFLALGLLLGAAALAAKKAALTYPKAPMSDQVDDYGGIKVPDPYRPLEDPDAPAVRRWIAEENAITNAYLAGVRERLTIRARLEKLWNYERFGVPDKEGGRYFMTQNSGLQNQSPLYVLDSLTAQPRLLIDPNTLSKDGTIALAGEVPSRNGKLLAYGLAAAGSDWNEWKVRSVDTGEDTADDLKWVKFSSASWALDDSAFYYSRYDEPKGNELTAVNKNQKVYLHRLGTTQAEDRLIYSDPEHPDYGFAAVVTEDGRYLVLFVSQGTDVRNGLYEEDLSHPEGGFTHFFEPLDSLYNIVGNVGPVFYLHSQKDAPNGKVVALDVSVPAAAGAPALREVVPETKDAIQTVSLVGHRLVVERLKDAASEVALYGLDGREEKKLSLPALGSTAGFTGHTEDTEMFYSFTSFTYPTSIYRYDFASGESTIFRRPAVDFDPAAFETKEVFYPSKDGTNIPLFLVSRKGTVANGRNPTLLYGYGGFDISETPSFSVPHLLWIERGGLYAQACLRGGGEYGEAWHQAGMFSKKQNVFDDFAWAAKWLIANLYTSAKHLAIEGRSNGGLLVGATLNQHPELFGAAIPHVGVMDMLRFQKWTIGWAWVSDYGSSDKPEEFPWLRAYSPYHNIKDGAKYPAVMVVTGDHDDRVVPAHSFKYAARLQAAQGGSAPILIRIETRAGHGAGKPTAMRIDEAADIMAFLTKAIGG
jgi:prolyl oligopeptidase